MFADRYRIFARYNQWANRRLYAATARLDDDAYRAERGAFFGSIHGTLNHLLVTDRIWLHRMAGDGPAPTPLDAILHTALPPLAEVREAEDERLLAFTENLSDAATQGDISYTNSSGVRTVQPLHTALDHLFNHQTHHRGQVHCLLTGVIGKAGAPSLDLVFFMRETGLGGVRTTTG